MNVAERSSQVLDRFHLFEGRGERFRGRVHRLHGGVTGVVCRGPCAFSRDPHRLGGLPELFLVLPDSLARLATPLARLARFLGPLPELFRFVARRLSPLGRFAPALLRRRAIVSHTDKVLDAGVRYVCVTRHRRFVAIFRSSLARTPRHDRSSGRRDCLARKVTLCRSAQAGADHSHTLLAMGITTTHKLLTGDWTSDVETVERGIGRFKPDDSTKNDCQVVLFEIVRDIRLHVNVTHRHETRAPAGWAGPASLREGFVHNRTFGDMPARQIVRHIREMVFAERVHAGWRQQLETRHDATPGPRRRSQAR